MRLANENETMTFTNGMISQQVQAKIQKELRRLHQKFAGIRF